MSSLEILLCNDTWNRRPAAKYTCHHYYTAMMRTNFASHKIYLQNSKFELETESWLFWFFQLTGIALCTRTHIVLQWFQMARSSILTWARFAGIPFGDFTQRSCKSNWASALERWHRRSIINFADATILTAWSGTGVTWIQMLTKCTHISTRATVNETRWKKVAEN